jgi:hypothetical protein
LGRQRFATDTPISALDLIDDDRSDSSQILTLDLHHRLGQALDDGLLLSAREYAFDQSALTLPILKNLRLKPKVPMLRTIV